MSSIAERMAARQQQAGGTTPLDALLQGAVAQGVDTNSVRKVKIDLLHSFSKHTFKIREGTPEVEALIQSVKTKGIAQPLIVRSRLQGGYEIIAGHTRCYAAKQAGLTEVPVIVHECADDEAIELMAETNKQRESWLPSERAKTYALWWNTVQKRQGKRVDLTCGNGFHKLSEPSEGTSVNGLQKLDEPSEGTSVNRLQKSWSRDIAGEYWGISGIAFQMYVKLNDLIPDLLSYTDEGRIAVFGSYEIAFLSEQEQKCVADFLEHYPNKKISKAKGKEIRQAYEQNRPHAPIVELMERCMGIGVEASPKEHISVQLSMMFNQDDIKPKAIKRALEDESVSQEIWAIISEWVKNNY